jgi:formylmethanofuran dehydrogenase subunit E
MKIKNITTENFQFEGVEIPAGEVVEVDNLIGQRLLALYWHRKLELVEDTQEQPQENVETEQIVEQVVEQETNEEKFVCDKCGKDFAKKVGFIVHKRFCKE